MTFTIGRASFTNAPSAIRHNGDRVDIDINIRPASLVEAKVLRQQVLGLANNDDEPVVPLTWSDDSDYDGFYRVLDVDVEPTQAYLTNRLMRARLSVERVGGGYGQTTQELDSLFVEAGTLTITKQVGTFGQYVRGWHLLSPDAVGVDVATGSTGRVSADGTVLGLALSFLGSGESQKAGAAFIVDPADHYNAACVVEQLVSGSWYPVVGKQLPASATVRVSNGLVRFTVESTGELTVENYDGTAWRSKGYDLTPTSGTISGPSSVIINRNGVDAASVTFICALSAQRTCRLSASVRLGFPLVDLNIAAFSAQTWTVTRASSEAGTVMQDDNSDNYGIRATSNDANGHRYVIVARDESTPEVTTGALTLATTAAPGSVGSFTTTTSVNVGIGMEISGSSATAPNDATSLGGQYQVATSRIRTVAR